MGLIYADIPELEGSNTEISLANLSVLERSLEEIVEARLAHIFELSEAIVMDGEDEDIVKSIVLSIKSEGKADSGNLLSENRHVADLMFQRLSNIERLTVLREVFGKLHENKSALDLLCSDYGSDAAHMAAERIAYIKNSFNDAAYMQFSSLLSSPRAAYYSSVTDVCDSVSRGECEFCILPLETANDGKLLSFYELIFKNRFKIVAVYDMNGADGYTRYALLGKRFAAFSIPAKAKARHRHFEIAISQDEVGRLDDLLTAAEFCSLKISRIDTLSLRADNNSKDVYFSLVLKADGADMQTFLSYLAIDCPDFIPIGLYNLI